MYQPLHYQFSFDKNELSVPDGIFLPWVSSQMKQNRRGCIVHLFMSCNTCHVLTGTEVDPFL